MLLNKTFKRRIDFGRKETELELAEQKFRWGKVVDVKPNKDFTGDNAPTRFLEFHVYVLRSYRLKNQDKSQVIAT